MSSYFKLTVIVMLVIAVSGCGKKEAIETEGYVDTITNVEFFTVLPTKFEENITLPIVVLPYKEVNLGMTNGGRVVKINVDKGDRVKNGQVLLETDDTVFKAAYDISMASLEYQKGEFARAERLLKDGSITEAAFDAAKLGLAQAQSNYDMTRKNYADATLEAPFSGIVTMRDVEIGDILSPGMPAFRIIDMRRVKVQAGLPEKYITDFEVGNKVFIKIDAIKDREFEGTINYIAPEASPEVRTFLAEMIVDNSDDSIRAGVMGNAQIIRNVHENALMIPINALTETQKGHVVFVLKEGNVAEERLVDVLGGNDLMVRAEGLSAGERIITKGNYDLIDGEKVNVTGEYTYAGGEEGL